MNEIFLMKQEKEKTTQWSTVEISHFGLGIKIKDKENYAILKYDFYSTFNK